ncbi:MAG: ABC transporter ATP-binding protein [Mycoplasmoidaceae bacterium]|nr:MAG: ABC transporter ATP-binding protein [Mycoplasmoidaceae bacterium]
MVNFKNIGESIKKPFTNLGKKLRIKHVGGIIGKSLKFIGPNAYWWVVFLFLNSLIATALSILSPIFLRDITNQLNNTFVSHDSTWRAMYDNVTNTAIMILTFYLAKFILSDIPYNIIKTYFDQKCGDKFRRELFKKVGKMPFSYFDNTSVGHNMTVMVSDTSNVSGNFIGSICQVFTGFIYFIGLLIAMFIMNWQMALFCIISVPIFSTILPLIIKKSRKLYQQRRESYSKVNGNIEEMFSNTLLIRAANKESEASAHFDELADSLYKISKKSSFIGSLASPMFSITNNLIIILIVIFATTMNTLRNDRSAIDTLPSFLIFVGMFNSPFSIVSGNIQSLFNVTISLQRIFTFLETEEIPPEPPFSMEPKNNNISFKHVNFGYSKDKMIINDFNIDVSSGKMVAIVGPTGSGKSTIVNLLMRFYEIDSGDITVGDISIYDINREKLRAMFSMVLQEPWVFNGTIKDNIIYNSKNVSKERLELICEKINLLHFIKTLPKGFETVLNDSTGISAGEKQLITIARLLVKDAPFVILDEATSNVDTQTELEIQKAMSELVKNKTSFVIAHRLSTIKKADIIIVLKDGLIAEKGTHEELLNKNGEYAKLYNSQFVDCA